MSSVDSMKQDNGQTGNMRYEILEVAPVARTHVALSSTHHISTAHMFSNGNTNISNGKQSCNWNTNMQQ